MTGERKQEPETSSENLLEPDNLKDQIIDNRNKNYILCRYCNSLILKQKSSDYIEFEFQLPLMHQKNTKDSQDVETEIFKEFWFIPEMFTFENIGFSNTVNQTKYLVCADCDMGPVGYHDINTKKSYIALQRVKYSECKIE